jgi:predicted HicB family RNase H-like nuclease
MTTPDADETKQVLVRMPKYLHVALSELAKQHEMSVNRLIIKAVIKYIIG